MKTVYCPYCGGRAKRNGRTSSGSQRWRCTDCGASTTVRCDDTAAGLDEVHRVVFVDGIYLARDLVVLIARLRRCGRKPWSSAAFGMLYPR